MSKTNGRPFVPCGDYGDKKTAAMNAAKSLTESRKDEVWEAVMNTNGGWSIQRVL